jgi:uncharacterized protein (UPF0548 family)
LPPVGETEWRLLRGWSAEELRSRVDGLVHRQRNFDACEEREMTGDAGWHHYHSEAVIAQDVEDDERFERARVALAHYRFSDPSIVMAHFDPDAPLPSRRFLLEIKVLGLRYLCAALVTTVRDEPDAFGFRYDTLDGHIERGVEWFLLTRDAAGRIRFRIEARWQHGDLPNWWSRIGFALLSGYYQRRWHREAHRRMSLFAHEGSLTRPRADRTGLTHQGLDVTFTYHTRRRWLQ